MGWVAYVDESMRQRREGSGIYVLAAAVLDSADTPAIRESTLTLLGQRHRRVHWRAVQASDRHKVVATVAQLDALHLVVVAQPFGPDGEPLLWLPDIVAGAVGSARGDGDARYLAPLAPILTEFRIELD